MMEENIKKNPKKGKTILLSLAEAAELTGYTPEYLNLRCRQGKLKGEKRGRNWFTTLKWVEEFSEKNISNGKGGGAKFFQRQELKQTSNISSKEESEKKEETKKSESQPDVASVVLAALNFAEESRRQEQKIREERELEKSQSEKERRERDNAVMQNILWKNTELVEHFKNRWEEKDRQPKKRNFLSSSSPIIIVAFMCLVWFLSKDNSVINLYNNNISKNNVESSKEEVSPSQAQVAGTESEAAGEEKKYDLLAGSDSMTELEKDKLASVVLSAFGISLDGNGDLAGDIRIKENQKIRVEASAIDSEKIRDHTILARDIKDDIRLKVKELITSGNITTGGNLIITGSQTNSGITTFQNGIIVSGGNVVFSTSGTISQTGLGQVAFAGNVDAQNGLDVTGGNLTVGGNNFVVNYINGNISTLGDIDAPTGTIVNLDGTNLSYTTANLTTVDLGTNTITDGNLNGNWNINSGNLDMQNNLILNIGNANTDFRTGGGLTLGDTLLPYQDVGTDLGTINQRFNNIYVANMFTTATSTAGQAAFTYEAPTTSWTQSSIIINPTNAIANAPLLGVGVGGNQRFLVDEEGDVTMEGVLISNGTGNNYFAGNLGIGTTNPTQKLMIIGGSISTDTQFISTLASGTAPIVVSSNTLVTNLNSDYLDGQHGAYYATAASISGIDNYIPRFNGTSALENSIIYDDGTNVGIGTTAPNNLFELAYSTQTANTIRLTNTRDGSWDSGNIFGGMEWKSNDTSTPYVNAAIRAVHLRAGTGHTNSDAGLVFYTGGYSADAAARMVINYEGNVGIGTTNPGAKFEVNNGKTFLGTGTLTANNQNDVVLFGNSDGSAAQAGSYDNKFIIYGGGGQTRSLQLWQDSGGDAFIDMANVNSRNLRIRAIETSGVIIETSDTDRLTIDSSGNLAVNTNQLYVQQISGNVGIGTTNPTQKLMIIGGSISTDTQFISTLASGTAPIVVSSNTLVTNLNSDYLDGQHGAYYATAASISGIDNYIPRFNGTSALENSIIYDDGTNVGIGTTAPGAKLNSYSTNEQLRLSYSDTFYWKFIANGSVNNGLKIVPNNNPNYVAFGDPGDINNYTGVSIQAPNNGQGGLVIYPRTAANSTTWWLPSDGITLRSTTSAGEIVTTDKLYLSVGSFSNSFGTDIKITIDSSGNVGIGTTAPTSNLHIFGDAAKLSIQDDGGASLSITHTGAGIDIQSSSPTIPIRFNRTTGADIVFDTDTLYIDNSENNVGIGTTNPTQKLMIIGGSISTDTQLISTLASGTAPIVVSSNTLVTNLNSDLLDGQHGTYYAAAASISGIDNYIPRFNGTSALENSIIYDDGTNVGIGTTSPQYFLDVQQTSTATSGPSTLLSRNRFILNPSGASTANYYAGYFNPATSVSANNFTGQINGLMTIPEHYGTGTISSVKGIASRIRNLSSGTITNAYSIYSNNPANSGGGTITTAYGIYIEDITSGGTNYGIYSAGGTAYFAGNVGIGTTNPGAALEIAGQIKITGGSPGANYVLTSDAVGLASWTALSSLPAGNADTTDNYHINSGTTNYLIKYASGTALGASLVYDDGTNVGIGTTSPEAKLDVVGNIFVNNTIKGKDDTKPLRLAGGSGADIALYGTAHETNSNDIFYNANLHTWRDVTKATTFMALDSSALNVNTGFVFNENSSSSYNFRVESDNEPYMFFVNSSTDTIGIGTGNPISYAMLEIDQDYTYDGQRMGQMIDVSNAATLTANASLFGLKVSSDANIYQNGFSLQNYGIYSMARNGEAGNRTADFLTGSYNYAFNSAGTTGDARGTFGIVTAAGGTITDAYGIRGRVFESGGTITTGYGGYFLCEDATTCYGMYVDVSDPDSGTAWGTYVTGEDKNYFSGNVGIGDLTPTQVLTVNGRISMATWTADGDAAAYRDNATNSIALATSDQRLKKNIVPIPDVVNALKIVTQLNGYFYNDLDESDGAKKRLGLMSQEVLPLIPELTFKFSREGSDESYYGVHYDKLTALLLEAIKQQQGIITDQGTLISSLKEKQDFLSETDKILINQISQLTVSDNLLGQKIAVKSDRIESLGSSVNSLYNRFNALGQQVAGLSIEKEEAEAYEERKLWGFYSDFSEMASTLTNINYDSGYLSGTYDGIGNFGEILVNRSNGIDLSSYDMDRAFLTFDVYMENADLINDFVTEFGNKMDVKEIQWAKTEHPFFQNGWNEVKLPISSGIKTGEIDWADTNYFRLYFKFSDTNKIGIRNVRVEAPKKVEVAEGSNTLTFNGIAFDLSSSAGQNAALQAVSASVENNAAKPSDIAVLQEKLVTLEDQVKTIQDQNQAVIDFATALNVKSLVYKDSLGNIDLGEGKITVKELETQTIRAKKVDLSSGEGKTSGKNFIKSGKAEFTVLTTEADSVSKIYVTPIGSTNNQVLYVDEIKDGESFKVKVANPAEKDIQFNWLIIK